jgi:hypothetical protein
MRISIILLIIISLATAKAPDTLWSKTYLTIANGFTPHMQETPDSGFIILAKSTLIRINKFGDTLWTRKYSPLWDPYGTTVQLTSNGGFIITGNRPVGGHGFDVWLIRTDSLGNVLWERTYGEREEDIGSSVLETSDKGFIIIGHTLNNSAGSYDIWLIKTDSLGDTLWTRKFGGKGNDLGYDVKQTLDGGYILTGIKTFQGGGADVWLIRVDSLGRTRWTKNYGGNFDDYGKAVNQLSDGGFIVAGYTRSFGNGEYDFWVLRTDSLGDTLWSRTFGGSQSDIATGLTLTKDRHIVVVGHTYSFGNGINDAWILKIDLQGKKIWEKTIGGSKGDRGTSILQTRDGGLALIGSTNSFGQVDPYWINPRIWLIKFEPLIISGLVYDFHYTVEKERTIGIFTGDTTRDITTYDTTFFSDKVDSFVHIDDTLTLSFNSQELILIHIDTKAFDPLSISIGNREFHFSKDSVVAVDTKDPIVYGIKDLTTGQYSYTYIFQTFFHIYKKNTVHLANDQNLRNNLESFLMSLYPNPITSSTKIHYNYSFPKAFQLSIYNVQGHLIRKLNSHAASSHIIWDGKNQWGQNVASGLYILRAKIDNKHYTKKLIVQR